MVNNPYNIYNNLLSIWKTNSSTNTNTLAVNKLPIEFRENASISGIVQLSKDKPIVYYTSLSQSTFTNIGFACADKDADNCVYNWEVIFSDDVDVSKMSFDAVQYVGNDEKYNPEHSLTRIDSARTSHVFSVRLMMINGIEKWHISYNYSFK
jgi:hypothetical protein